MASFAAFLEVNGVRYPLLTYSLRIHQETDSLGRPASPTFGGTIDCVLATPGSDQPFLTQWMFSPTMQQDGQLVLMQDVPRTTLKTISFFNAYCVGLQTRFQPGAGGGGSLQTQVRISPQRVAVGTIIHDNNWPVESHGAGQSYARAEPPPQNPGYGSEDVHAALDLAGYTPLPFVGAVAGIADTGLYLKEGDLSGAVLAGGGALLGVVPFGKLAGKGIVRGINWIGRTKWSKRLVKNVQGLFSFEKRVKLKPEKPPINGEQLHKTSQRATSTEPIQLTKSQFGHTFSTHGQDQTDFLIKRARGSGKAQGQFLDDQAAARFIKENQDKVGQGAISVPAPEGFPARVINPDGTFSQATHIRLVPGGKGVKTAYPEIIP